MRVLPPACLKSVPWGRGLFPVLMVLFVMIRVGEAQNTAPGWVRNYGDDLLCLPLVLGVILMAHRLVARDGRGLPLGHGLLALASFTIYFELILPVFSDRAVGDPLDGLMYLAGFLVFQFFMNKGVAVQGDRNEIFGKIFPQRSPTKLFRRNHGHL